MVDIVYINSTIYGRHWLDRPAADSWNRMVRDGCPPEGITDAGRTIQEQIDVFTQRYRVQWAGDGPFGDVRFWNGVRYVRVFGAAVAVPGSIYARHTTGNALDLHGATKTWVRANGHRYGWIKDVVPKEDWHIEYQAYRDAVLVSNPGPGTPTIPTVPTTPPITPIEPEDDFLSHLTYEEQRRLLMAADQTLQWGPKQKEDTDRLPHIHQQVDLNLAMSTNAVNGIIQLLGRKPAVVDVDEEALAAAIAALLGSASDLEVSRIAKAAADESDRRERERLGS